MSIATSTRPAVVTKPKHSPLFSGLHLAAVGLVVTGAAWLAATTGLLG